MIENNSIEEEQKTDENVESTSSNNQHDLNKIKQEADDKIRALQE